MILCGEGMKFLIQNVCKNDFCVTSSLWKNGWKLQGFIREINDFVDFFASLEDLAFWIKNRI